MLKQFGLTIVGTKPLIMHNGELVNPLNPFAKEIKKISGKRGKTEADHERIAELEFLGGLWLCPTGPCIPSYALEACFVEAARKTKRGKQASAGILVLGHAPLIYDGPRDADELWKEKSLRFFARVRVGQARVIRCRPCFTEWSASFEVEYADDLMEEDAIKEIVRTAGQMIGIGDWRPKYGRFALSE